MIDIEQLILQYFQNDFSCPYKLGCGYILNINPIKVKDWSIFERSLGILEIDKNKINDFEIIQMSYLEFLCNKILSDKSCTQQLINIFNYAMNEDNIHLGKFNNKSVLIICDKDDIKKGFITSKEFDEISKIILFQNIKDYDDREVNEDVKELMQEYYKIKYRDIKDPTLEEKKTYVIAKTGIKMSDINEMTYRTFSQVYKHSIDDVLYIGDKIIQGSEKYEMKKGQEVKHPLFEKPKDPYAEIFSNTSVLSEKGIKGAEQLNMLDKE